MKNIKICIFNLNRNKAKNVVKVDILKEIEEFENKNLNGSNF